MLLLFAPKPSIDTMQLWPISGNSFYDPQVRGSFYWLSGGAGCPGIVATCPGCTWLHNIHTHSKAVSRDIWWSRELLSNSLRSNYVWVQASVRAKTQAASSISGHRVSETIIGLSRGAVFQTCTSVPKNLGKKSFSLSLIWPQNYVMLIFLLDLRKILSI